MVKRIMAVFILSILVLSAAACSKKQEEPQNKVSLDNDLPVVGSVEKLKQLLKENRQGYGLLTKGIAGVPEGAQRSMEDKSYSARNTGEYSKTNVQVEGVDEGDLVKTDGKYIYQVNDGKIVIINAVPAGAMKIAATIKFPEGNVNGVPMFTPNELYVDGKNLVVVGYGFKAGASGGKEVVPVPQRKGVEVEIYPDPYASEEVKVLVYDISALPQVKKVREASLEGYLLSSRKIGTSLYLAVNKHPNLYRILEGQTEPGAKPESGGNTRSGDGPLTPSYSDSAAGDKSVAVDVKDIRYFPKSTDSSYLMVAGLDLEKPEEKMNVATFLGSGTNVYASTKNLYIAASRYDVKQTTQFYRFGLEAGKATYNGKGEVPGTILNQFSMDENGDNFRVATTKQEKESQNNVYILDKELKITGKVENIAPGEFIYSARFVGSRCYLVTFKTVDPFFVIDLANPKAPKILGALKIPGYSNYLHPYDENHVIGFGKDTAAMKGQGSKDIPDMAYYQGMKMAMFDVTDVTQPKEMFKEIIGDRGTDSELLYNHKALLFSRDKDLLAFPVRVALVRNKKPGDTTSYGEFVFQGAYIYHVNTVDGFIQSGRITHLTGDDIKKSGLEGYYGNRSVERILYIGDSLFTLSKGMVKANDLNTMKEIKSVAIN